MAHAVLPKEIANAITVSLISDVPALQAAVAIQASREKEGQDLPHIRWRTRNSQDSGTGETAVLMSPGARTDSALAGRGYGSMRMG